MRKFFCVIAAQLVMSSSVLYAQDTNMVKLLRLREQGACIKHNVDRILERKDVIEKLMTVEEPKDFYYKLPKEYHDEPINSYEDNQVMRVVPQALADRPTEFKNNVLELLLSIMPKAYSYFDDDYVRAVIIAVIKAGADPDLEIKTRDNEGQRPIAHISYKEDDLGYAKALIALGAKANVRVKNYRTDDTGTVPLLFLAKTCELAELLIRHGAVLNADGVSMNKTVLHEVVDEVGAEPALLKLYLGKYKFAVDAPMRWAFTPLQLLVYHAYYYRGGRLGAADQKPILKEKLMILLEHGADYLPVLAALEHGQKTGSLSWEIISKHHSYRQEVERLSNIDLSA